MIPVGQTSIHLLTGTRIFSLLFTTLSPFLHPSIAFVTSHQMIVLYSVLLVTAFILYLAWHLIRLSIIRHDLTSSCTLFEILPLQVTEQSALSTSQLFSSIHGLARQRDWLRRAFHVDTQYSFELVSTKDQGIRYLVRVPAGDAPIFKKNVLSYLPGTTVNTIDDYIPLRTHADIRMSEYMLSNHFAYPLKKQINLAEYDPIAYITGALTKRTENDLVSLQLIVSPLETSRRPDIRRITRHIYANKDIVSAVQSVHANAGVLGGIRFVVSIALHILMLPVGLMVYLLSNGRDGPLVPLPGDRLPDKTPNAYQQELEQQIKGKLDERLFTVTVRLMTAGASRSESRQIERGFLSALASYGNAGYQSLTKNRFLRFSVAQRVARWLFEHRLPSRFGSSVLSASEVSGIYHFPYTSTTKTENIATLHYRVLPAPLSLKQTAPLDIYFAKNTYGGSVTRIGLSEEERRRHVYILGATGTGKSTLLLSMIRQDINNGKGFCVIDPHGDLVEKILPCIPDMRLKDVIYFNPDDIGYPIGINLLELTSTGTEEEKTREKEFITESIISLFHKLYPDRYSGPRMEYILRNTIHTAYTTPHPTLFTIYKLLTNTPFRRSVTTTLEDENLRDFWRYEFAKAGDYQKVKMISPITNKIGRFLFSASAKRILEQETSSINFDTIMDSGKILICNLSKGRIGEDTSEVFGILIMTKIQLAALKRAREPIEKRRDFYLYVDEFQNFATPSFSQILSEARKYRLGAILAHQTTSQLTDKSLVNVTLANTGTVICFRTANPEDEKRILPQFYPYISQGELASLPSFHFYMKVSAINPEEPFSGETILMSEPGNKRRVNEVINESRKRYAVKYMKKEAGRTPSSKPQVNTTQTVQPNPEDRQTYQTTMQYQ